MNSAMIAKATAASGHPFTLAFLLNSSPEAFSDKRTMGNL
jgi:hypothetical protein